ncbi:hypothetical protein TIFTF001_016225 [Ficus carica]|uniref:Uncharacterized protein n=1 Tax=Ficus carica TaxID=3494 RepID=A0AA88D784_FICCA|nr:hypothetical protein TIFTF001_016225 [Ficus carica]
MQERTKKAPQRGIKQAQSGLQRTKHLLQRALKLSSQRAHFCKLQCTKHLLQLAPALFQVLCSPLFIHCSAPPEKP